MIEKNIKLPDWLIKIRKDIKEAKRYWEGIYSQGRAEVKRGLETEKVSNQRLQELKYIEHIMNQDLQPNMWNDDVINASGNNLFTTVNSISEHSKAIYGWIEDIGKIRQEEQERFCTLANSTAALTNSMFYSGAEMEKRWEAIIPSYKPVFDYKRPGQIKSREEIFKELREILDGFNSKFTFMLDGSEDALKKEGIDHLSQAAHSMRDLFQQIIEFLAPSKIVKKQSWFEATPEAPDGVSRRSRIRYLLYGSASAFEEIVIKQFDEAADHAKEALDLVISRAHNHDPQLTKHEVELAIDHARSALLKVLKQYRERKSID